MRSPVTIYISQVLHEKQEIFFTKQRANAVFNAICACTDNELIFSGSCRVFQSSQEKSNTMVMQKFGGYTRCIMVLAKMVNSPMDNKDWRLETGVFLLSMIRHLHISLITPCLPPNFA